MTSPGRRLPTGPPAPLASWSIFCGLPPAPPASLGSAHWRVAARSPELSPTQLESRPPTAGWISLAVESLAPSFLVGPCRPQRRMATQVRQHRLPHSPRSSHGPRPRPWPASACPSPSALRVSCPIFPVHLAGPCLLLRQCPPHQAASTGIPARLTDPPIVPGSDSLGPILLALSVSWLGPPHAQAPTPTPCASSRARLPGLLCEFLDF